MQLQLYGYACGTGADDVRTQDAPDTLRHSPFMQPLQDHCHWNPFYRTDSQTQKRGALPDITRLCTQLAKDISQCVSHQQRFLTLGGDHSCAIGTWSGAADAVDELGLIWIDAHLDSHTFSSSPTDNIHGMPVAALLGEGACSLTTILNNHPKIKPENIVIVGARSYEIEEQNLLKDKQVHIIHAEQIIQHGLKKAIDDALAIVTANTSAIGFSLDLDAIDPDDAPGVGSPEAGGIRQKELLENLPTIIHHPTFIGAEVAELNPHLDTEQRTEKIVIEIIRALTA